MELLGIKTTSLFTGNILQDSGRLNLSSVDTISGRTDEDEFDISSRGRGQGGAGDLVTPVVIKVLETSFVILGTEVPFPLV